MTSINTVVKTSFAIIEKEGKILLIQEGYYPAYGKWCLPGGHVDTGESLTQAAVRETFEETGGLKAEVTGEAMTKIMPNENYQGREEENGMTIEVNIFKARQVAGEIDKTKLTEELDVRWFTKEEAKALPLRWEWLKDIF